MNPTRSPGATVEPTSTEREQRDLQAALDESEVFYSSLVESLPQNILRKDLQGRFTFANSRCCQTLGMSLSQIVGRTDFDLFPTALATQYQADDRAVIQSGAAREAVEAHQTPTGLIYVRAIKAPVRDRAGRVVGIQCIFWDVTEQKVLEEHLHYERELLRGLLESSLDNIYFKDLDSRFLRASRSLATQLGLADPAEIAGKTSADFFSGPYPEEALKQEQEVIRTGEPAVARMEREVLRDGQERWVMTSRMPFRDSNGTIRGTMGISRDVTELKLAEDQLAVARDSALESARLKSEFLANMSHEIRTPLNAVIGMSGLLLDTSLDADQRDLAGTVRTSADVLLGIVNDILDFSKIEAGKMTIENIDFDLTQVIEEAADLVAEQAQAKGLELVASIAERLPAVVRGDPSRIRQVLVNLLSNAVKFTSEGEVVVAVDLVAESDRKQTFRWEVRDTGIGVSEEARGRLFNAFTQADGSTTRRYGGTGLGLAICRRLVSLMGGEIGLASEVGKGTTFWFTLPLDRHAGTLQRTVRASLEGVRVLIVDDNQTNRTILHRQTRAWKMRDGSAASGPEALVALREAAAIADPYALVVLDMQMPDMDGMSVARAIKSDPALKSATIVILTSLAYHPDDGNLQAIGISAYLTKPVKQSRLYDCLATLIGQRTSRLPLTPQQAEERMPWQRQSTVKAPRVLVAEDNPVNQKVAMRLLQKLGVTADAVSTGLEAIRAVERAPYDVILMDCQMPELDGYEATQQVRQWEATGSAGRRHYVIAVTAHALDGDREHCLEAGMDDYISKPISMDRLAEALCRATERR